MCVCVSIFIFIYIYIYLQDVQVADAKYRNIKK